MMTPEQVSAYIGKLAVKAKSDESAPPGQRFFAYYIELPGCFAEAENREAAVRRLEEIAPLFIQGILDEGGELPSPASSRITGTTRLSLSGLVAGDLTKLKRTPVATGATRLNGPVSKKRLSKGELVNA